MSLRKRLRELIARPGLLLIPGAYDAMSARIIEAEGFQAVACGGGVTVGSLLAQPDTGQCNMRDYADNYARVCAAVELPVLVDGDTGFGGPNNVRQMVRAFETAGVAGLFFSDQTFPNRCAYHPGKSVVPIEQMLAKIKAALDARRDPDLLIVARTDAASVEGVDAAIERCQLFLEAGADIAKPQTLDTPDEIRRAIREIPCPHIVTLSQMAGRKHLDFGDLQALGVAAATLPSVTMFAAAEAIRRTLRGIKRDNTLANIDRDLIPLADYYQLVGLKRQLERERAYDEEADALVKRRAARR
ncbi:MAG TPA: oxaloacetate decarboxylase [Hyphomicrobiaceae bacterium]|nr:oxaloacetate decarboxylase [Hyphomicrobiaceae bacterium]